MSAVAWTYLLFALVFDGGLIGGCAYVVFWLGYSGWWFALAIFIGTCGPAPDRWADLGRAERRHSEETEE